ncbi:tetratricopeptide repeat protein [Brevundimonas sp.]|uniref:tetratricopeptide repeat protein n=1 Tax=Brevundimonas sp. TaxID=1871086 RepID=UPI003BAC1F34
MTAAAAFDHDPVSSTIGMPRPSLGTEAGDAASPAAISRLAKALAGAGQSAGQRKANDRLKTAMAAIRQGDYEAGVRRTLQVLKMDPANGPAWHILAICQEKSGALTQALSSYEAALKLSPDNALITHDLGRLALRLGMTEIAEKLIQRFLSVEPGHLEATNNLACVYRDQERYDEAVDTLKTMLQIEPGSSILWNTLGAVLSDQGRMKESLVFFDEALRLDPGLAKAQHNRANARQAMGDEAGALEDLEAAIPGAETDYERAMMQMARAMALMALGRLKEGFEAYEARLDPAMPKAMRFVIDCPRWDPQTQDIAGKRLLVVGEQGIADEMVFGGALQDIIDAVGPEGQVYVAVEPRLVAMFQRSFPSAVIGGHLTGRPKGRLARLAPFVDEIAAREGQLDFWTPMASLLAVYRTDLSAFPDREGYLAPDAAKVDYWKAELEKLGPGFKVGLHWKSSLLTGPRARYFAGLTAWEPVLKTPGCLMVNLQCGDIDEDMAAAKAAGATIWTPPIDLRNDLEDLAALSSALDLVVGPGIAGVNIAAATGARTWLIYAPDDWHLLSTDHYPFYPRVRMFGTGSFDGWPRAMAEIREALDQQVALRG